MESLGRYNYSSHRGPGTALFLLLPPSFPFWSDRGNGWSSERALSRHSLRGERLAAGWAGLAITKSNTAREALACFGTPDDLLIAVRQGFLTQDLVGSFAGRLNMLG